jgi:hypothetical protein
MNIIIFTLFSKVNYVVNAKRPDLLFQSLYIELEERTRARSKRFKFIADPAIIYEDNICA